MFNKKLIREFGFVFMSIWLSQFFCVVGIASDLRDLLLSGDFIREQSLIPSPLGFVQWKVSGEMPKLHYVFSLRTKLDDLSILSKAELEEILAYRQLLTRQLLLEVNENGLLKLEVLLKSKANTMQLDPNRAYLAAFFAKRIQTREGLSFVNVVSSAAAFYVSNFARSSWGPDWREIDAKKYYRNETMTNHYRSAWNLAEYKFKFIGQNFDSVETPMDPTWRMASATVRHVLMETLSTPVSLTALGKDTYDLSVLVTLNWLVKNSASSYERAFNEQYEKLDGSISMEHAKEEILKNRGVFDNIFDIEFTYFISQTEAKIKHLFEKLY